MSLKRENIKVLVLSGDGINCEAETAQAFQAHGVFPQIIHIQDLIEQPFLLDESHILVLPGGFSFGDEIGSGQILALKLKHELGENLAKFVNEKKLVIGICNGFQVLVRLGLLPRPFETRTMTLTHNRQGYFMNRWVDLVALDSKCVWTKKLAGQSLALPIRHGEGRIVFSGGESEQRLMFNHLCEEGQIALTYKEDVNGSHGKIAGVCDPQGLIFGLMPHPEAAVIGWQNPGGKEKDDSVGIGSMIFLSGIEYCEQSFS